MKLLRRVLSEPLVQFLAIGIVVFGFHSLVDRTPPAADDQVIEVGPGRMAQLHEVFSRTWQRPPTQAEMEGLIEAFVKEEIFYREGRKMGLDEDDTVLRRRLQQKMEFLAEPSEAELNASDEELRAYLAENAEAFRIPIRIAYRQVFLDPARRGEAVQEEAAALLAALRLNDGGIDANTAGDPTLLPHAAPLMPVDRIEGDFDRQFAEALSGAEVGRWSGPFASTFGIHLVLVDERIPARDPGLDEVRDIVLREWQSAKRRTIAEERYQALRRSYRVTVTPPAADTASTAPRRTGG